MKKNFSTFWIVLLLGALTLSLSGCVQAVKASGQMDEREFAQSALENYVKYALNEKNVQNFGFANMEEAQAAKVGDPIQEMILGLRNLKEFKAGTALKEVLVDPGKLYFPVMVDGETRTKIEIVLINKEWVAGDLGGILPAQIFDQVRQRSEKALAEAGIKATSAPVLLEIPVLHAAFLYIEAEGGEFLIPAMPQAQEYGLDNGQVYPVEKILPIFVDLVQKIAEDEVE